MIRQLDATAAAEWLKGANPPQLIDVREPREYAVARIEGAQLIPLATLPGRVAELDRARPILVHCHHGGRSQRACEFLLSQGFEDLTNLSGGIEAWSRKVDPSVPQY